MSQKVKPAEFLNYIKSFGKKGVHQTEIVRYFGLAKSSVSDRIKRLVEKGLITKESERIGRQTINTIKAVELENQHEPELENQHEPELENQHEPELEKHGLSQGLINRIAQTETKKNKKSKFKHYKLKQYDELIKEIKEELGMVV